MDASYNPENAHRQPPTLGMRGPKGYKLFKNPPQPHMCIQDSIKGTSEKLYINVMSWKQIGNTKQCADLIPLYGGMQIQHGCMPNCNRPPLTVFAVMVNPEILKVNGKNAPNPDERDALVGLLCEFVEAMNPGLQLTRQPIILKDRDLAGELKDVWHAVQLQREREKLKSQEATNEVTHKIYHIDGPPERDPNAPNVSNHAPPKVNDNESENNTKNQNIVNNLNNSNIEYNIQQEILALERAQNEQLALNNMHPSTTQQIRNEEIDKNGDSQMNNHSNVNTEPSKSDKSKLNSTTKLFSFTKNKSSNKTSDEDQIDDDMHEKSGSKLLDNSVENKNFHQSDKFIENSNQINLTNNKTLTVLIDDNKDIPFVDEYHENDRNDIICKNENVVDNMLQSLNLNKTDTQMSNFDQKKVPLPPQKS